MTADVEDNYIVAQANEPLTEDGHFANHKVAARYREQILEVEQDRIDFMDVSPKMVVSVATSMIPFLENDDANRALMGSNMQRQAVPLLKTERPFVGTGMEYKAAVDSGVCVLAPCDGVITAVSADTITLLSDETHKEQTFKLEKFKRSNQGTCINQRPIVDAGEHVTKGQVLADGPSTSDGEISLGKNALIGFMTWEGYNYEDAVLINEKVVLMEFLMQAITRGSNDVGRVHVQVQCGSRTVHGFAAHTDTTRASIEAFLDALRVLNVTERKEKEE